LGFFFYDWFGNQEWVYDKAEWWVLPVLCTVLYFTIIASMMSDKED